MVSLECPEQFQPASGGFRFIEEGLREYSIPEVVRIGEIHYTRLPVFDESDPRENNWLFRWANRLHVITKTPVISNQVLISEGDQFVPRRVEETARILRQRKYLL